MDTGHPDLVIEQPSADSVVVVLTGERDLATSAQLAMLLDDLTLENELVVVDLSNTAFIDSSTINTLLVAGRIAGSRQHLLRLQVPETATVRRVLEIADVPHAIDCVATREEAVRREV